jgi:GrpB-like predicted nucleotidyltransferase (UPF0157 family)
VASSAWPLWATETVRIVGHDPAWAATAQRLAGEIERHLGDLLAGPVEHVGSTAVPGLAAKPIIDLLAPVPDVARASDADPMLERLGWHPVPPELDERPWRRFAVLAAGDRRVAHLHLLAADDPRCGDEVAFRNALRNEPTLAAAYAQLKWELADAYPHDREAYTHGKTTFVSEVLAGMGR